MDTLEKIVAEMREVASQTRHLNSEDWEPMALNWADRLAKVQPEGWPRELVASILSEVLHESDDTLSVGTFDELVDRLSAAPKQEGGRNGE